MASGGAVRVNLARSALVGMPAWRPPGAVRTASRGTTATGVEQARIGAPGVTMGPAWAGLPDRHIAHRIPGQKCQDLAIHILRGGHSGHLRPTLDYLQGLLFPLGLHW